MDQLIKQLLQGEIFWYETDPARPVNQSAFLPYQNTPRTEPSSVSSAAGYNNGGSNGNMNKRMIELLRKRWRTTMTVDKDVEKERCFRHMMNERMRREKQKRYYSELHSVLPVGTKNDKKTIVQTAATAVQELELLKMNFEHRNYELQQEASLSAMDGVTNNERTKVRLKLDINPTSGNIDSMLEVLKCMKNLDSEPRMLQSNFTNQQLLAVMDFDTEIAAAQVENAVNRTSREAERKVQKR